MRKIMFAGLLLMVTATSVQAAKAKEEIRRFAISPALALQDVRYPLDPEVRLAFGSKSGGKVIGTYKTTKRARGTDVNACNQAFHSAVVALQQKAMRQGGNAVVDIHSYHRNRKFNSSKEFECATGRAMSAVTLRGTAVSR